MEKDKFVDPAEQVKNIQAAILSDEVPKFYVNGFAVFQGNADMGIVFQCNGRPNLVINTSFTLAKTLSEKINQMVSDFEKKTGINILTTSDVDEKMTGDKHEN